MQTGGNRCSVQARKPTDVFSSASELAQKLRAARYIIDPVSAELRTDEKKANAELEAVA
jgi:hypothetical protein